MSNRRLAPAPIEPIPGLLEDMLDPPAPVSPAVPRRAEGIAVGRLEGLDPDGTARVSIAAFALSGVRAASTVQLGEDRIGAPVALGFEGGNPRRPIVLGLLIEAPPRSAIAGPALPRMHECDGRIVIEAQGELELRCGEARVLLVADGTIRLRGRRIDSHAKAAQRIRGGSVQIN